MVALATYISPQAIRYVHGKDSQCWKVEGTGCCYHGNKQGPIQIALSSLVDSGTWTTELLSEASAEEHGIQS